MLEEKEKDMQPVIHKLTDKEIEAIVLECEPIIKLIEQTRDKYYDLGVKVGMKLALSERDVARQQFHLSDVSDEAKALLGEEVNNDDVWSLLVCQMRDFVWPILCNSRTRYADVIRFTCNLHKITRNVNRNQFDEHLRPLFFPEQRESLVSPMKKSKFTNDNRLYRYYSEWDMYSELNCVPQIIRDRITEIEPLVTEIEQELTPVLREMTRRRTTQ